MARIAGIDLKNDKKVFIALRGIYGIGKYRAEEVIKKANVRRDELLKNLDEQAILKLRECIESDYKVEGELRSEIFLNLKRLKEINCYRGNRHKKGLPVRGQRTHSNAKTRRLKSKKK